jgi:predicted nucleotidyltransferase
MDLSFPLATVAPTLDAGVLHVLAATTAGCTAGEVHRRLRRGSDEGVRKVLGRLVVQGVVNVETLARYPVYHLNREHLAVPYIEALTRLREVIVDRLRGEIANWKVAPVHAGLFGSCARGIADSESDIDVLLVRPECLGEADESTWLAQLDRLEHHISAWTGNAAQVIDLTSSTLGKMAAAGDPLVESWRADDILLNGERLPHLLRRLR